MTGELSRGNLIVQIILSLQMWLLIFETVDLQTVTFLKTLFPKASLSIVVSAEHGCMGTFNITSFKDRKNYILPWQHPSQLIQVESSTLHPILSCIKNFADVIIPTNMLCTSLLDSIFSFLPLYLNQKSLKSSTI